MEVKVLGCGSATPTHRHQPSCQVVEHHGQLFMIDCGEGAQQQFRHLRLKFGRLKHIFISHLHGDHLFGLPGLLSTMDLHEVDGTVTVHIHPEGARLMREWMSFFLAHSPLKIEYDVIEPGESRVLYENKTLEISTFPLKHRMPCNGFLFREKEHPRHIIGEMVRYHQVPVSQLQAIKSGADFVTESGVMIPNKVLTRDADPEVSYAYCSDTMPSQRVVEAVKGVDLLYHEATYDESLRAQAKERGHSTARQAAEVAREAGVGKLMIGHFSKRYESDELLLKEARAVFPNTILADEGRVEKVR